MQKTVQKLKLNFSRSTLFHTNPKVCLIYFGQDCSNTTVNTQINEVKGKIPRITNLVTITTTTTTTTTTTDLKAKINEVKGQILNITNLATTIALTAVENKIPNVSNLGVFLRFRFPC